MNQYLAHAPRYTLGELLHALQTYALPKLLYGCEFWILPELLRLLEPYLDPTNVRPRAWHTQVL